MTETRFTYCFINSRITREGTEVQMQRSL